ncbi:hypothetical protein [Chromobacterium paludis]|uniref:Uncharacterized protein n=1 Tax=Chromobacterium paludis TaxID=2605945 RepID=A0A5C1DHJ7_9NEIS|nr:hypothetical protein [Chromobacterium paludis]QEL55477.1 hypothetical protein FYK34_07820 [Chromobacterium paludis]
MDRPEALRLAATLHAGRLASMEGEGYVQDDEVVEAVMKLADKIQQEAVKRRPKINVSAEALAKAAVQK